MSTGRARPPNLVSNAQDAMPEGEILITPIERGDVALDNSHEAKEVIMLSSSRDCSWRPSSLACRRSHL